MLKAMFRYSAFPCLLWLLLCGQAQAQQLLLSDTIWSSSKAALLELKASKQGLLLPRILDTTLAPLNTSPDGMVIYYTPLKSLMVRRNGYWSRVADSLSTAGPVFYNGAGMISKRIKIWADSVSNTPAGLPQVDISSAGFSKILSVNVTARGGTDVTSAPSAAVLGYTLSRLYLILMESKTTPIVLLNTAEGLELHNNAAAAATKIFVTVIGY
ncbi:hypothetical protein [Chitinophaga sp. MM2321]|uniref:hypothetical protein n=1 Tax=Chitinophaga sp. MM2321 TaxID=3137178 RepID=UPI0032D582D4